LPQSLPKPDLGRDETNLSGALGGFVWRSVQWETAIKTFKNKVIRINRYLRP